MAKDKAEIKTRNSEQHKEHVPGSEEDNTDYFNFDLSQDEHPIILPSEKESAWEQLHDITWDQGRGD